MPLGQFLRFHPHLHVGDGLVGGCHLHVGDDLVGGCWDRDPMSAVVNGGGAQKGLPRPSVATLPMRPHILTCSTDFTRLHRFYLHWLHNCPFLWCKSILHSLRFADLHQDAPFCGTMLYEASLTLWQWVNTFPMLCPAWGQPLLWPPLWSEFLPRKTVPKSETNVATGKSQRQTDRGRKRNLALGPLIVSVFQRFVFIA